MFKIKKGKMIFNKFSKGNTHSYIENISFTIVSCFMWLLFAFNTYNIDMPEYKLIYQVFQKGYWHGGVEVGFACVMKISAWLNASYEQFLIVYSFVSIGIVMIIVLKYSKKPTLALILYMFFPFLHELCALRFFLGNAIALCATQKLLSNNIKSKIIYVLLIVIASLFHRAILVYLLYLLCYINVDKLKKIIVLLLMLQFFSFVYFDKLVMLFINILPKLSVYLSNGLNGTRNITKVFFIIYYIAIYFFTTQFTLANYSKCNSIQIIEWQKLIEKMMYISILFFPIIILDVDFYRVGRCTLIFFYMWFGNYLSYGKTQSKKNKYLTTILFLVFVAILTYFFMIRFSYDSVIKTIFENNSIIGGKE